MKKALLLPFLIISLGLQAQYFQEQDVFSGNYLEPYDFKTFDGHLFYLGEDDEDLVQTPMYFTNGMVGNVSKQTDPNGDVFNVRIVLGDYQNNFYFYGYTGDNPGELWRLNSAGGDAVQVTNTNDPNAATTLPIRAMREVNGVLFFNLVENVGNASGNEIWTTDGTPEGTEIFLDINPNGDGFAYWVGSLDGIQYFAADNGVDGLELWRTDGTLAGTYMVKDINPSGDGLFGEGITYNGKLYFQGRTNENGRELWSTDGTEEGTQMLIDLNDGSGDGLDFSPRYTLLNDRLFFIGTDGASGREFWSTDGTAEGTALLANLAEGSADALILNPTLYNGRIYFGFQDLSGTEPRRLWATDGTEEGTLQIAPGEPINHPRDMFQVDNELVFLSNGDGSNVLWRTDGTDAGTYIIEPEGLDGWEVQGWGNFAVFGGRLFIDAALNEDADLWSYGANDIMLSVSSFEEEAVVTAYPNPVKDVLWFNSEVPVDAICIFGIDGKLLRSEKVNHLNQFSVIVDELNASGFYLVELQSAHGRSTVKVQVAP